MKKAVKMILGDRHRVAGWKLVYRRVCGDSLHMELASQCDIHATESQPNFMYALHWFARNVQFVSMRHVGDSVGRRLELRNIIDNIVALYDKI